MDCIRNLPSVLYAVGWAAGRASSLEKMGGWWRWALVGPDGMVPRWMVSVSASVSLPLHHKVQKFYSGTGLPGWSTGPRKRVVVVVYQKFIHFCHKLQPEWHDITTIRLKMPLNPNQPNNNVLYRPNCALFVCQFAGVQKVNRLWWAKQMEPLLSMIRSYWRSVP